MYGGAASVYRVYGRYVISGSREIFSAIGAWHNINFMRRRCVVVDCCCSCENIIYNNNILYTRVYMVIKRYLYIPVCYANTLLPLVWQISFNNNNNFFTD